MNQLQYGNTGWRIAEWQLAVGREPSGTFDLGLDRATRAAQVSAGMREDGIVTDELIRRHGTTPMYLRTLLEPEEALVLSCQTVTRHGAKEWNALAHMVTRGKGGGGKRYDWSRDWVDYHARVCRIEWDMSEESEIAPGALTSVRGKPAIVISAPHDETRIVTVSMAPLLGRAGLDRVLDSDLGPAFGPQGIE